jgi:Domain of unknown function (DUF5753)
MLCSPPKISRIETGARSTSLRDVRDLCNLYRVEEPMRARRMTLASEAKQQSWWNRHEDIAIGPLIGLEIEAVRVSSYESCVIPRLLQTEGYVRTLIEGILPRISELVLARRVAARQARQENNYRRITAHHMVLGRRICAAPLCRRQPDITYAKDVFAVSLEGANQGELDDFVS